MAVNETIVTGRYFRKLIDAANRQWQRFSFWTKASDVEFDDGKNAEEKIIELKNRINELSGIIETLKIKINAINTSLPYKITFNDEIMNIEDDKRN